MPSRFPGMDPYIESQVWEDFHARFIASISDMLVERLRPRYVVQIEKRVFLERDPEEQPSAFIADAAVFAPRTPYDDGSLKLAISSAADSDLQVQAATVPMATERRESYLVIRRAHEVEVVTVIELLSPTNKKAKTEGRRIYLEKRMQLFETRTHLVEIDLLLGGERMPMHPNPYGDYLAMISRAPKRPVVAVYAWPASRSLPSIPIPLAKPDPDVMLDLQAVFTSVYDRAGYDYALDYTAKLTGMKTDL